MSVVWHVKLSAIPDYVLSAARPLFPTAPNIFQPLTTFSDQPLPTACPAGDAILRERGIVVLPDIYTVSGGASGRG